MPCSAMLWRGVLDTPDNRDEPVIRNFCCIMPSGQVRCCGALWYAVLKFGIKWLDSLQIIPGVLS